MLVPGLVGGVLSTLSYGLVLWAQTQAPLAPVAVLRITAAILMVTGIALMVGTT